ncbi:Putative deoxyribonuclease YjjV [Salmonella enterica subsp. enterica]|uniref:Deoxyribonuclease YjjV n=1 Tax=Salmonella enterica I TaxID=59201 RepID=A0A379X0M6_SALET|nr:Putative deoxyribonuclease YjjV [Salmonella enterica subsp. enterica]
MARLPLDALLLETDAPDMPLKGFQGSPNRPEQAARVFDALCELRPEPAEVIADTLYRNTITLFGSDGIAAAVRQVTLTNIAPGKISFATPTRAPIRQPARSTSCGVAPWPGFRFAIDAMRMKGIQTHRNLAQRSNKRRQ